MAAYFVVRRRSNRRQRRAKQIRHRQCLDDHLYEDFIARELRLSNSLIEELINILDGELGPILQGSQILTTKQKVLTSLKVLSSGSHQLASKDFINISQPSVSVVFNQFLDAMYKFKKDYIHMPNEEDQQSDVL